MKDNIPDFQTIMYPVMKILRDNNSHTLQELYELLAKEFNLKEEELRILVPSGQQLLFKNRLTWSISYLKNAGLLNTIKRGVYQITEQGQSIFKDNISSISTDYLKKFEGYKLWHSTFQTDEITKQNEEVDIKTPEEIIGENFKKINSKLAAELLELIKQREPAQFERFVLELLNSMGYGGAIEKNFEVVGQSGDNGIDGIIYQDKLGIDRVYVQAKRWNENKVQSKDIRDFIGSLSLKGTNKGVFITTSQFTDDALKTAKMNPQNIIILIDGKKLSEYAIQFNVGVELKEQFQIKGLDLDFFDEL
jgi:restriction system protein